MLDLGWPELFIIMLVALLIVGPKELPGFAHGSIVVKKNKAVH